MDRLSTGITSRTSQNWVTYVAQEKGFFNAEGLDHSYISFKSMQDGLEAVTSGAVPICSGAADTPIAAVDRGLPIRIIGALASVAFGHVVARPGISSLGELAGKRVGVIDVDSGSTVVLKEILRAGGLNEGHYIVQCVGGTPERYAALVGGEVDAVYLSPPFDFKAQDEGFTLLADCAAYFPNYAITLYANQGFLSEHPMMAIQYLRALIKASRWLYDPINRDEAIDILVKVTGSEVAYAERTYRYVIEGIQGIARDCTVDLLGLDRLIKVLERSGLIKAAAPVSDYVDATYLGQALASL